MVQERVHHRSESSGGTLNVATESLCQDHGGTSVKSKCKQCKKEYDRRRHRKNRDKILDRQRRYRRENREKITEQQRRHYKENRDKKREYNRRYYRENRDEIVERHCRYRQENRDYLDSQSVKYVAAKNRASQYLATNSGKPWTPQEAAKMHRLRRQGLTNYEVAVELGRSLKSVHMKIYRENARH